MELSPLLSSHLAWVPSSEGPGQEKTHILGVLLPGPGNHGFMVLLYR